MRKYVRKKADSWSQPIGLTKLMAVAALKIVAGKGPFDITQGCGPRGHPPRARR
jgi:hypothetical protein